MEEGDGEVNNIEMAITATAAEEPLIPPQQQQEEPFPPSLLLYLYAGHFLARWSSRMWEFSVGLYMIDVWPDTLLLAAAYGVVESASSALFGPLVGQWVDRLPYAKVLQLWLLTQNLSFMVAGGTVITLLVNLDLRSTNFTMFLSLVGLTNFCGALGVLSALAGTILIEREWVVVISEGHPQEHLAEMNSVIRRIDLVCKLLAPVVTGFIISFISLGASALALSLWNVLSVCFQYWLLMSVYNGIPSLRETSQRRLLRRRILPIPDDSPSTSQNRSSEITKSRVDDKDLSMIERFSNNSYFKAWRVYLQQDVVLPGVALALLFFTVLSFGTLMTATLQWKGIPAYIIGIARGANAATGIAATFLYPIMQGRISALRTGLWSIWSQWTCLLVCVASIWVQNNLSSACLLMGGVIASRLGLWTFDLCVIQQMQDQVPESDRIVVGGVQNSLQSALDLLTYVMGICISNPQDFWKLIVLSFLLVTAAGGLYSLHVYRVRKHLIHFDKLFLLFPSLARPS